MIREVSPLEPYYNTMLNTEVDFELLAAKEQIPEPRVYELSASQLANTSKALGRSPEKILRDNAVDMFKQHFVVRMLEQLKKQYNGQQLRNITEVKIKALLGKSEVEAAKTAVRQDMKRIMGIDPNDVEEDAINQALDKVIGNMLYQVTEHVYQALEKDEQRKLDAMAETDERYHDAPDMLLDYANFQWK